MARKAKKSEEVKRIVMSDYCIGVDPDKGKSGVAVYDVKEGKVDAFCMDFPSLVKFIVDMNIACKASGSSVEVIVEADESKSHNWHVNSGFSAFSASKVGKDIGRNLETGLKLCEMCRYYGVPVRNIQPIKAQRWAGKEKKVSHEAMVKVLESCHISYGKKRENQDVRDAIMISIFG